MFKEYSKTIKIQQGSLTVTYKATNNLTFQYITDLLKRSSVDGALAVPMSRSSLFDRSYSYTASKLWNSIPIPIRNASSLTSFGDRIKSISINNSLWYFVSIFHFILNCFSFIRPSTVSFFTPNAQFRLGPRLGLHPKLVVFLHPSARFGRLNIWICLLFWWFGHPALKSLS